jgi:hypothetical protein
MDPSKIELENINKMFEYEKLARIIDELNEEQAKDFAKAYIKLYLKQQEVIAALDL